MKNNQKNAVTTCLPIHNLSTEELAEAIDWREEIWGGNIPQKTKLYRNNGDWIWISVPTWNRNGCQKLIMGAMEVFSHKAKMIFGKNKKQGYNFALPWNMAGAGAPWWSLPHYQNFSDEWSVSDWVRAKHPDNEHLEKFASKFGVCCQNPVEYAARFAGWLKIAGEKRGLVKVLMATTTPNGMGSPYTTVNPFHIFDQFPSPHHAERQIWKIRRRANQILKPYGISVSWEAIGNILTRGSKAVGKAAIRAASHTLAEYLSYYDNRDHGKKLPENRFRVLMVARGLGELKGHPEYVQRWAVASVFDGEFESLREALVSVDRLKLDETDGVRLYIDPETEKIIHGVSCVRGWSVEKSSSFGYNGQMLLLRQKHTGRSYHVDIHYFSGNTPRGAVKIAIGEWHKQIKAERKNKKIFHTLKPKNASILVWFSDSLESGNCSAGTRAWAEQNGFNGDMFVSAEKLLKFSGDSRVFRILQTVAEKVAELKIAI